MDPKDIQHKGEPISLASLARRSAAPELGSSTSHPTLQQGGLKRSFTSMDASNPHAPSKAERDAERAATIRRLLSKKHAISDGQATVMASPSPAPGQVPFPDPSKNTIPPRVPKKVARRTPFIDSDEDDSDDEDSDDEEEEEEEDPSPLVSAKDSSFWDIARARNASQNKTANHGSLPHVQAPLRPGAMASTANKPTNSKSVNTSAANTAASKLAAHRDVVNGESQKLQRELQRQAQKQHQQREEAARAAKHAEKQREQERIEKRNKQIQEQKARELREEQFAQRIRDRAKLSPEARAEVERKEEARQELIRKKEERNVKNRAAIQANERVESEDSGSSSDEGSDDEDEVARSRQEDIRKRAVAAKEHRTQIEDGLVVIEEEGQVRSPYFNGPRPTFHHTHRSTGPIGLNDLAQRRQEQQLDSRKSGAPERRKKNERERLNDVTYADVRLLALRGTMDFDDVAAEYNRITGKSLKAVTIRKRARCVDNGLKDAAVPAELIERFQANEEGAFEEVNRLVYGNEWVPCKTQPLKPIVRGQYARQQRLETTRPSVMAPQPQLQIQPPPQRSVALPSRSVAREPEHVHSRVQPIVNGLSIQQQPQPRPTQGGKTIGPELLNLIMREQTDISEEEYEEEAADLREPSPPSPEDFCHFAYQPERREGRYNDYDGIEDPDELREALKDEQWISIGEPFELLKQADHAAAQGIVRTLPGQEPMLDFSGKYTMSCDVDEESGMPIHELTSNRGIVQVRVSRFMRTFAEGVVPEMKHAWMPKTVYMVKSLVSQQNEVGVGEIVIKSEEKTAGVFTDIEIANHSAIDKWIELTVKPETTSLTMRETAKTEARKSLREKMVHIGKERTAFDMNQEDQHGRGVRVWVAEEKLQGPRNI
ncbi:hypothetical protein MBLNU230_g7911t1 [Neophaeotheca triangularis]